MHPKTATTFQKSETEIEPEPLFVKNQNHSSLSFHSIFPFLYFNHIKIEILSFSFSFLFFHVGINNHFLSFFFK